jgi:hypothetical protein
LPDLSALFRFLRRLLDGLLDHLRRALARQADPIAIPVRAVHRHDTRRSRRT